MSEERKDKEMKNQNLARDLEPERISYAELQKFDDDQRYELIDGIPYLMSSPRTSHQDAILEIASQIRTQLREKGKSCRAFIAPLDVKLSGEPDDTKEFFVVQPDIMVICDKNKITEKNILGAPDLAIEILSPSNPAHDRILKLNLYKNFGVREYWIVSLEEKKIHIFNLKNDKSNLVEEHFLDEKIYINISDDIYVDLKEFCKDNDIDIPKENREQYDEKRYLRTEE